MKFLANENISRSAIEALRAAGFDVEWMAEVDPGVTDDAVLARATSGKRILLTFDKDFGELVFARGANASAGIILFRFAAPTPEALATMIVDSIRARTDWPGQFAVVEQDRVRLRPLPP